MVFCEIRKLPMREKLAQTAVCFMADASSHKNPISDIVVDNLESKERSYPHENGQWTTHVYVDGESCILLNEHGLILCPSAESEDLRDQVGSILEQHQQPGFEIVDKLHVSLFRGHFKLRLHQIQPFVDAITLRVSKIPKFKLVLNRIQILKNDEGTRSFICLKIDPRFKDPYLELLIREIESCLHDFEREDIRVKYPDPFITHCSLIWFQGDIRDKKSLNTLIDSVEQDFEEEPLKLAVDRISIKAGNQTFLVHLKP